MLSKTEIDELSESVLSFIEFYEKVILFEHENNIECLTMNDKKLYQWCMDMNTDPYELLPNQFIPSSDEPMVNKISLYPSNNLIWNQQVECFYYKWFDKPKPKSINSFYFYTFTGDNRIPCSEININNMKKICKDIFNNDNWKRFTYVDWCIETGKHMDNQNLHVHALIVFDKSNKNFERDFIRLWNKYFKNYGINFKGSGKQHFKGKGVATIYKDKLDYFTNHKKSVLHENYMNLNILEHVE